MIPLHAQSDFALCIPRVMHDTRNEVNGTDVTTEFDSADLYFGEANSITHMGAIEPFTRVATPMMKRPTMSCGTNNDDC
jgi:hypothetical protein